MTHANLPSRISQVEALLRQFAQAPGHVANGARILAEHRPQRNHAYLHHLFLANEMLGPVLLSLHNVAYYCRLMAEIRQAIREYRFAEFRSVRLARYTSNL